MEPRSFEQYAFLRKYIEKYPDRLDLVNTIVAVYNLGVLEPELCAILNYNTQHVLKISNQRNAFDASPCRYGTRPRKMSKAYDDDEEELELDELEDHVDVVKVRKPKASLTRDIYEHLKASGKPVSNVDLVEKFTVKDMHTLRNSISLIRKNFLQAGETLETIQEHRLSEVKHYVLKRST